MFRPRWRKVRRDLWLNKGRTLIVILSIAIGVFAVGTIATSQIVLSRDLRETYLSTNPAHATILTFDSFGDDVVNAVDRMREVEEAEARRRVSARMKVGPEEWRTIWLIAISDYNDIKIDQFFPEAGAWPPPDNEILIERAALSLTNAQMGDTALIKTPDGKEREMPIAGLAHDLNAQMYVFDGTIYAFITADTLEWLGEPREYNEMRIRVAENSFDRDHIREVTNKVRDKIEDGGRTVFFTFIPQPGQPPLDFLIQAISIILGGLGILSLLLSGFLVINTISALLTQQTRQIGMMKAVGARTPQVVSMYLVTVMIFSLLALLIAIPLGTIGAYYFSSFIASFLNFDVHDFRLPPEVLVAQVVVGLIVPLIAALYPVFAGARITVREAISTYGLGKGQFGGGWMDRLLIKFQRLKLVGRQMSRPLLLSLRNTFRRKGRLALTLMTLIMAGAIFIAVFSVRASLLDTLDSWLDYFQYDVGLQLDRNYRVERIKRESLQIPGVVEVESWGFYNARRERPDGSNSDNIIIFAPPAETKLIYPTILEGRWLLPEDQNAVVVNSILLRDEPDIELGDEIIFKIEGKEEKFQVVGISTGGTLTATAFMNYSYFSEVAHEVGRASWVFMGTHRHDLATQSKIARALEQRFEHRGIGVNMVAKVAEERAEVEAIFEVIVILLLFMAVLLAVIGGLGLMGTMSINVLERTREIGVMRAIGASNRSVRRVFIVEGVIIGLLSWIASIILAYPISKFLSDTVGQQFLSTSLNHNFSIFGIFLWLVVVVFLSAVASFLPAWNASRITVREVLAYE